MTECVRATNFLYYFQAIYSRMEYLDLEDISAPNHVTKRRRLLPQKILCFETLDSRLNFHNPLLFWHN